MAEKILTNCTVGGAVHVHVEDGVITRFRPIVFDKTDAPSWTIEARGKEFKPPRQTSLGAYIVPEKSRIYSEQRIKYPLKRVEFDGLDSNTDYSVLFEANGYTSQELRTKTIKDVNLGEVILEK